MKAKDFKKIAKIKKPKKIEETFTTKEYYYLTRALKEVISENYDEIIKGVNFTNDELQKLEEIKARRIYENHYQRFA